MEIGGNCGSRCKRLQEKFKWMDHKYGIEFLDSCICIVACKAVALQRPRDGQHVLAAVHEYSNRRAMFSVWSLPKCYKQGTRLELSFVREDVKRELEPEAEE
jgi:hypothetical protein